MSWKFDVDEAHIEVIGCAKTHWYGSIRTPYDIVTGQFPWGAIEDLGYAYHIAYDGETGNIFITSTERAEG